MLEMPALTFYALLEQSFKQDSLDWIDAANAASIAHMEPSDAESLMENRRQSAYDVIENKREAETINNESAINQLKHLFG